MVYRSQDEEVEDLDEIKNLAESAGYEVMGYLTQRRRADPKYQIGRGKVEELKELVESTSAERIIFNNYLKPVQAYNLAKATGREVIDRFQLILEIFARRASTSEAKLQIKLAQLMRELSMAKEKVRLARMGEQPGFSGLGKYEVDVYYETVKRQIHKIRRDLQKFRSGRELHRKYRLKKGFSLISLSGYTNSGKSTLFNAFTGEDTLTDKKLFTTLSTKTRLINISGRKVLLTDTVGFIDRLPIQLIDAFHSTLEETIFSDLILLVLDISEPLKEAERKLSTCLSTLDKIGASGIPIVTAMNKIDVISEDEVKYKLELLEAPNPIPVSALKGINLAELERKIVKHLPLNYKVQISLPNSDEAKPLISDIFEKTNVLNFKFEENSIVMTFESPLSIANKIKSAVEEIGGTFRRD